MQELQIVNVFRCSAQQIISLFIPIYFFYLFPPTHQIEGAHPHSDPRFEMLPLLRVLELPALQHVPALPGTN